MRITIAEVWTLGLEGRKKWSVLHPYHFSLDVKQKNEAQVDNVQDAKQNLQASTQEFSTLKHCQAFDNNEEWRRQQSKRARVVIEILLSGDLTTWAGKTWPPVRNLMAE
jgi:hypothetical protein